MTEDVEIKRGHHSAVELLLTLNGEALADEQRTGKKTTGVEPFCLIVKGANFPRPDAS